MTRNDFADQAAGVDDDPADTAAGLWLQTPLGEALIARVLTDPTQILRRVFRGGYITGQKAAKAAGGE